MERILIRSQDLLQGIPAEVSDHQIGEGYTAVVLSTDAQATVEALQRERDGLEAKCLEEHVTIEQADAKVMKLEGDKGMWANERRDLLTQLENAESQLSQLRALVREIKKEFDNCTHECERCGESDPLTTFDIYRTVAKAATLDAMTPAGGQG